MSTGVMVTHAHRTAVGKSGKGTLRETRPDDLLGRLIEELMTRIPAVDPADIDDVIVGCAFPEGEQGMNVARIAALRAGLPVSVPGMTINRFCSSGLQSLGTGAAQIAAGWSKIVLTGGVESMSLVPMGGQKPAPNPYLANEFMAAYDAMGITSETVAERYDVSREDQDAFAVESNRRALAAISEGRFKDEIIPLEVTVGGKTVMFDTDDGPRASTVEGLARLR
ncbi:MAG: acetyl-CoA C-acyltransferase, partial [Acidimicrobiia bacterium]|nr:acetyl-CoA C-acyltransferase [Acidimicrobiia bacterium]